MTEWVATAASSGRLQPRSFRLELAAQLRRFFLRKPTGYLRKNRAIYKKTRFGAHGFRRLVRPTCRSMTPENAYSSRLSCSL